MTQPNPIQQSNLPGIAIGDYSDPTPLQPPAGPLPYVTSSVVNARQSGGPIAWAPNTQQNANTLISNAGTVYIVDTTYTSGATFGATDLANCTAMGGGGGVSPSGALAGQVPAANGANGTAIWAARESIAQGLPLVASRNANNSSGTTTLPITSRAAHQAIVACSDLRLVYGSPDAGETDLPNSVLVKAGIEIPITLTLSSALSTGGPITTLPVTGIPGPIALGMPIQVVSGSSSQIFTTSAIAYAYSGGNTTIAINSATPNFAYPTSSTVTAGMIYPLTFGGREYGVIDYPCGQIISDPLAIELTAGQTFYSRTFVTMPMGAATTLAAACNSGATNLSLVAPPSPTMPLPQQVWVGGSADYVTVTAVTNTFTNLTSALTSGTPYTSLGVDALEYALPSGSAITTNNGTGNTQTWVLSSAAALGATTVSVTSQNANANYGVGALAYAYNLTCTATASSHAAAAAVQQLTPTNQSLFSDLGDRLAFTNDYSWATGFNLPTALTTTTTEALSVGATSVTVASSSSMILAQNSPTITIDTGGANPETIAVIDTGGSNTIYLAAATQFSHSSGVTVTGGVYSSGAFVPYAIVAERVASVVKPVLVLGDSIPSGNGNWTRALFRSFATEALDGVRPYLTGAHPSETTASYVYDVFSRRRRRLINIVAAAFGGWAIYEYGTNDVAAGTPATTIEGYAETIIAMLHARGLKVAVTTLTPKTTSTDNWTSIANQTLIANESIRLAYNASVRSGAVGAAADLVIDTAATVDSGLVASQSETGLWAVSATTGSGFVSSGGIPISWDGIHPTLIGHALMSAAVTAALPSMT